MNERTWFEVVEVESCELAAKLGRLIHTGNVRRIVIRQKRVLVAEFPLTAGVVGTMIAPIAAAVGALAALLSDCSIEVERTDPAPIAVEPHAEEPLMDVGS